MEISGLGALVSGGASGLGAATARQLADAGARVTIADLDETGGSALAARIGGLFVRTDVTKPAEVAEALDRSGAFSGTQRILVNCAGIAPPAKAVGRDGNALALSAFARVIEVNLLGTFNFLSQFAARLQAAEALGDEERGVIVNTASVAAFDGQIGQPAYSASKAGVVGMTLPLAREFAKSGIRVMAIAPGLFLTPMLESLPEDTQTSLGQQVPFPNRLGRPEEFSALVEAIIRNSMLNGEVIRLDGAIRMAPR
ncbi:MAG: SDR family NAD(P)-dependent oxidoreductase [Silicimonas sp.]|nr:SDR family NAD(P)-dependent oxidoreductase [Silicimonas sp.]